MMKFMLRYGWYIFLVGPILYLIDDYETNWHHHGCDATALIVLHNVAEDSVAMLALFGYRWWRDRAIPHIHAECPACHFQWLMHPKQKIPFCPRCGLPEPP
jgi:hypothetical protein